MLKLAALPDGLEITNTLKFPVTLPCRNISVTLVAITSDSLLGNALKVRGTVQLTIKNPQRAATTSTGNWLGAVVGIALDWVDGRAVGALVGACDGAQAGAAAGTVLVLDGALDA
jgi:hypothetical protein